MSAADSLPCPACSLSYCEIDAKDAKSLAEALMINRTLTRIEYAAARPHLPNLACISSR